MLGVQMFDARIQGSEGKGNGIVSKTTTMNSDVTSVEKGSTSFCQFPMKRRVLSYGEINGHQKPLPSSYMLQIMNDVMSCRFTQLIQSKVLVAIAALQNVQQAKVIEHTHHPVPPVSFVTVSN